MPLSVRKARRGPETEGYLENHPFVKHMSATCSTVQVAGRSREGYLLMTPSGNHTPALFLTEEATREQLSTRRRSSRSTDQAAR